MLPNIWITLSTDTNVTFARLSVPTLCWLTESIIRSVCKIWMEDTDSSYGGKLYTLNKLSWMTTMGWSWSYTWEAGNVIDNSSMQEANTLQKTYMA